MDVKQVLNILTRHARPLILQRFSPDSCIASTAIACDVLNLLDIPGVLPMVVTVSIYNPAMTKRINAEGMPQLPESIAQWKADPTMYGICLGDPLAPDPRPKRWPGHLIVISPGFLLDLSIDQASRPFHDIKLEPFWMPWAEAATIDRFIQGKHCVLEQEDGTSLVYSARPYDRSFTQSPDWREFPRRADIVTDLLGYIKRAEL